MQKNMEKLFNEIEGTLKGALIQAISESGDMGKCDPKIAAITASVLNCYVEAKKQITSMAAEQDKRYSDMVKFAADQYKSNITMENNINHLTGMIEKLTNKVDALERKERYYKKKSYKNNNQYDSDDDLI